MITMQDFVQKLITMDEKDLKLIGEGLAWYAPAQAERLKNFISYAQQEVDQFELREQQFNAERQADEDCIYYGVR